MRAGPLDTRPMRAARLAGFAGSILIVSTLFAALPARPARACVLRDEGTPPQRAAQLGTAVLVCEPVFVFEFVLGERRRLAGLGARSNYVRPHQALDGRTPSQLYAPTSVRPFPRTLADPTYPLHDDTLAVGRGGHVRLPKRRQTFLTSAWAGQLVGLREQEDGLWTVTFMKTELGTYDPQTGAFSPAPPPVIVGGCSGP
jgi:hypothetical protein